MDEPNVAKMLRVVLVALVGLVIVCSAARAEDNFGSFKGEVIVKFLPDGRMMKLEKPFGYIDPQGRHWDVPAGTETDGASIPPIAWVSYPPFTGKYRTAAVIHDYLCENKKVSWQDSHEVFYFAMRAAGVGEQIAKIMYGAVYHFGPRWGIGVSSRAPSATLSSEQQMEEFRAMKAAIEKDNLSLDQIARRSDTDGFRK